MSAPQFTPGPWRIANCDVHPTKGDSGVRFFDIRAGEEVRSPYDRNVSGYIDCGGRDICMVQFEPRDANAHLIAAAPDLYEACEQAFDFLGGCDDAFDIRAVLLSALTRATPPAKETGR